jgi:hypothetical protein
MTSWFKNSELGDICVFTSDSGYINSDIALQYLDHLILHLGLIETQRLKVLLMDNHLSHITPKFTLKAEQANIYVYSFPGHLTHILQPLDVGYFQPYAH